MVRDDRNGRWYRAYLFSTRRMHPRSRRRAPLQCLGTGRALACQRPNVISLVKSYAPSSSHRRLCHRLRGRHARECRGYYAGLAQVRRRSTLLESGLDGVDVVVHGRHSHERQPRSYLRRRLILTRQVPAIAADSSNEKALFWNPAGASFEQALAVLGTPDSSVGVIGGTDVFGMFLDLMMFSTCRGRPMCDCPVGGRSFLRCPRGLRRKCLQAMASTAASGRCLIRQNASRSLAGNVRQSPTDKTAGVRRAHRQPFPPGAVGRPRLNISLVEKWMISRHSPRAVTKFRA